MKTYGHHTTFGQCHLKHHNLEERKNKKEENEVEEEQREVEYED